MRFALYSICRPHCHVNLFAQASLLVCSSTVNSLGHRVKPDHQVCTAGKRNQAENVLRSSTRLALKSLLFLTFEVRRAKKKEKKENPPHAIS